MTRLMTLKDIADVLGKSVRTVELWINPGNKDTVKSSEKITEKIKRRNDLEKSFLFKKIKDKIELAKQTKKSSQFQLDEVIFIIRLSGNDKLADLLNSNAKYSKGE